VSEPATLRPVSGSVDAVRSLLDPWLTGGGEPLVVRTSGSTGRPKDVLLSSAALTASAHATHRWLGGPGEWLLALPVHYVAGLQVVVRSIVGLGRPPVALDSEPDLPAAVDRMQADRRYAALVPTQLHRWLADEAASRALAGLDAVLLGGGPAPTDLLERARSAGVPVVTTYGMTETCGGCVYDGYALDGVAVALDPDGRIRIGGPVLFDGYAGDPVATSAAWVDGWLRTPDLGELDHDGRLRVIGRIDDVVMSGGVNVSLAAVEQRLATMPGVDACAVIAVADPEWGSRVVAVVATDEPGVVVDLAAVREHVAAEHPRAWAPREVRTVPCLPLLSSGKVDRQEIQRWWRD